MASRLRGALQRLMHGGAGAQEEESAAATATGCPFGFGGGGGGGQMPDAGAAGTAAGSTAAAGPPPLFGRHRVVVLYEEYICLPGLRRVWDHPVTEKPELEPCFAAACQAAEIGFSLLAAFLSDTRAYVVKRPRVELVAEDLVRQCELLAEIVDGELEEEPPFQQLSPLALPSPAAAPPEAFAKGASLDGGLVSPLSTGSLSSLTTATPHSGGGGGGSGSNVTGDVSDGGAFLLSTPKLAPVGSGPWSKSSLTQHFPFPGCPPTTSEAARSPALELLHAAVQQSLPRLSPSERVSLVKVVRNVTNAVEHLTQGWTVGLGLEAQLNGLRALVGLPRLATFDSRALFLDYGAVVRPEAVAATVAKAQSYEHAEDFFFRSVHLGTDCWAFVANQRLDSARLLAERGEWHNAAARARQAAHILGYLGKHVLMLTSMVLRDYLQLKVEIEGTSGEGSKLVRAFRPTAKRLFDPLKAALLALGPDGGDEEEGKGEDEGEGDGAVRRALLRVYESPERHPQLYTYAKALELLETGLVGGFYYQHFLLATNVIGLGARGTMNRAVTALKATYETPLFPLLDRTRSALGERIDARLRHRKGKLMHDIIEGLGGSGAV